MRVIDCFTFFNELDLLEFRFKLLDSVVDNFVICESNLTFSGNSKPYYFEENIKRFDKWIDKIIYLPIEQTVDGIKFDKVDKYTPTNGPFLLEYQQRNALSYVKDFITIEDSDLVLVGDLDEMPNPDVVNGLKNKNLTDSVALSQLFHYYYMNCQVVGYDRIWQGTVVSPGKIFKDIYPQHLRDNRNHLLRIIDGGWHFSYLGGVDKIKKKIQSFAHTEFNRPDITDENHISKVIEEGKDVFNRPGLAYNTVSVDEYPDVIKHLMFEYPQFIKDVS